MINWWDDSKKLIDPDNSPLLSIYQELDILSLGDNKVEDSVYIPFHKMCKGNVAELVTIDTATTWQFETPAGSIWKVRQITKKGKRLRSYLEDTGAYLETSILDSLKEDIPADLGTWELTIEAPPVSGPRPSIRVKQEGTKLDAMHVLGVFALYMVFLEETYGKELEAFDADFISKFPSEAQPYFKSPIDIRGLGSLYKKSLIWGAVDFLAERVQRYKITAGQLSWVTVLLLHETCIHSNRKSIEQGEEMAKNNGGHVWWSITGGQSSVGKVTNSLTKDRHFIVLDSPTSIFLRIQRDESTFANGIVKDMNCKLTPATEPPYDETLCGKKHTNVSHHTSRCGACARVRDNSRRAEQTAAVKEADKIVTTERALPSTSSPDGKYNSGVRSTLPSNPTIPPKGQTRQQEEMEWQSKNGAIISIKAPQIDTTNDFEALAQEYEDMSEQLLTKSTEYAELASKLRNFGKPSQAVQEAQAALEAAIQRDEQQRAKDLVELKAVITSTKKED